MDSMIVRGLMHVLTIITFIGVMITVLDIDYYSNKVRTLIGSDEVTLRLKYSRKLSYSIMYFWFGLLMLVIELVLLTHLNNKVI